MWTNLISICDATWILHPLNTIFLSLDGIVYSLVSYSYRLFNLMTQLNYNVLYEMIAPLIDRVKAVIMVFILFKIGVALLQYMVNPDEFSDKTKGGKALLINILVAAGLLGIYSFVFKLGNDLSMLIIGTSNSSNFQVIKPDAGENMSTGLLGRFIFGSSSSGTGDDMSSFGKYLATSTLNMFIYGKYDDNGGRVSSEAESIFSEINTNESEDFDFMRITTLVDDIGRTVEYKWPILSGVMGLFLIYSIVKLAIEVGVRTFKLIVLQIIAPIPIISIVSDGVGKGMFKQYISLYSSTFLQLFVRVGSMYVMTGFIGAFYTQLMGGGNNTSIFSNVGGADMPIITKGLLLIIIIVAGYTFVNMLPKFLSNIFGNSFESSSGGFGKFMKGALGTVAGGVGGFALGRASGLSFGDSLLNAGASAATGAKGGKIADNMKQAASRANRAFADGGIVRGKLGSLADDYGIRAGRDQGIDAKATNIKENKIKPIDEAVEREQSAITKLQNQNSKYQAITRAAADQVRKKETSFGNGHKYAGVTSSQDLYNRMASKNEAMAKLQYNIENATSAQDRASAQQAYAKESEKLRAEAETAYNVALNDTEAVKNSGIGKDLYQMNAEVESNEIEIGTHQANIGDLNEQKKVYTGQVETLEKQKSRSVGSSERYTKRNEE